MESPTTRDGHSRRDEIDHRTPGGTNHRLPVDLKHVPPELLGKVVADDLIAVIAVISDRPEGALHVCAVGVSKKQFASVGFQTASNAVSKAEVSCVAVEATQSVITVKLPPLRKFDLR
ncbi:MAG: hypothetical protein H6Q90_2105 [Deltaproteobacteria bacterium]|nr:hypothetical protein [Deltaproteobacteria bacterium]